jgi:hypothetical protein
MGNVGENALLDSVEPDDGVMSAYLLHGANLTEEMMLSTFAPTQLGSGIAWPSSLGTKSLGFGLNRGGVGRYVETGETL